MIKVRPEKRDEVLIDVGGKKRHEGTVFSVDGDDVKVVFQADGNDEIDTIQLDYSKVEVQRRVCIQCGEIKDISQFSRSKGDVYHVKCKDCISENRVRTQAEKAADQITEQQTIKIIVSKFDDGYEGYLVGKALELLMNQDIKGAVSVLSERKEGVRCR